MIGFLLLLLLFLFFWILKFWGSRVSKLGIADVYHLSTQYAIMEIRYAYGNHHK